jgi:hypothetical protein
MGHFKREPWAASALTLVQGRVHVDFAAIAAKFVGNASGRSKGGKGSKDGGTQVTFMMEFECPQTANAAPAGKKRPRHPTYRAALRYVPLPTDVNAYNFYHSMMLYILAIMGRTESAIGGSSGSGWGRALSSSADMSANLVIDPLNPDKRINHPFCTLAETLSLDTLKYCGIIFGMEVLVDQLFQLNCPATYPDYMQPVIDQSKNLNTDTGDKTLPQPFDDYSGDLPYYIPQDSIDKERATLFWLFDKTQQLGPWSACNPPDGSVQYPFKAKFAPGFGPPTFHHIRHDDFEFPGSNFTETVLAQSSVSDDTKTFLLAFRGTKARSEWIADFKYNQVELPADTQHFFNMRIHAGFAELFGKVYPSIQQEVANLNPPPERILVAGHSLGAGVTQLVSYALAKDFPSIRVDAAMFAPPAAGDWAFVKEFNAHVNGRRVAYVSDNPSIVYDIATFQSTRIGDIVPQAPCPFQKTCLFLDEDVSLGLPVNTFVDGQIAVNYEAVYGNILFDYSDLPDAPASYNLSASAIRDAWLDADNLNGVFTNAAGYNAHICSYSCFLSKGVKTEDADLLAKCLLPSNLETPNNKIPPQVAKYGICTPAV